jgi:hypothetical protein
MRPEGHRSSNSIPSLEQDEARVRRLIRASLSNRDEEEPNNCPSEDASKGVLLVDSRREYGIRLFVGCRIELSVALLATASKGEGEASFDKVLDESFGGTLTWPFIAVALC